MLQRSWSASASVGIEYCVFPCASRSGKGESVGMTGTTDKPLCRSKTGREPLTSLARHERGDLAGTEAVVRLEGNAVGTAERGVYGADGRGPKDGGESEGLQAEAEHVSVRADARITDGEVNKGSKVRDPHLFMSLLTQRPLAQGRVMSAGRSTPSDAVVRRLRGPSRPC